MLSSLRNFEQHCRIHVSHDTTSEWICLSHGCQISEFCWKPNCDISFVLKLIPHFLVEALTLTLAA